MRVRNDPMRKPILLTSSNKHRTGKMQGPSLKSQTSVVGTPRVRHHRRMSKTQLAKA